MGVVRIEAQKRYSEVSQAEILVRRARYFSGGTRIAALKDYHDRTLQLVQHFLELFVGVDRAVDAADAILFFMSGKEEQRDIFIFDTPLLHPFYLFNHVVPREIQL